MASATTTQADLNIFHSKIYSGFVMTMREVAKGSTNLHAIYSTSLVALLNGQQGRDARRYLRLKITEIANGIHANEDYDSVHPHALLDFCSHALQVYKETKDRTFVDILWMAFTEDFHQDEEWYKEVCMEQGNWQLVAHIWGLSLRSRLGAILASRKSEFANKPAAQYPRWFVALQRIVRALNEYGELGLFAPSLNSQKKAAMSEVIIARNKLVNHLKDAVPAKVPLQRSPLHNLLPFKSTAVAIANPTHLEIFEDFRISDDLIANLKLFFDWLERKWREHASFEQHFSTFSDSAEHWSQLNDIKRSIQNVPAGLRRDVLRLFLRDLQGRSQIVKNRFLEGVKDHEFRKYILLVLEPPKQQLSYIHQDSYAAIEKVVSWQETVMRARISDAAAWTIMAAACAEEFDAYMRSTSQSKVIRMCATLPLDRWHPESNRLRTTFKKADVCGKVKTLRYTIHWLEELRVKSTTAGSLNPVIYFLKVAETLWQVSVLHCFDVWNKNATKSRNFDSEGHQKQIQPEIGQEMSENASSAEIQAARNNYYQMLRELGQESARLPTNQTGAGAPSKQKGPSRPQTPNPDGTGAAQTRPPFDASQWKFYANNSPELAEYFEKLKKQNLPQKRIDEILRENETKRQEVQRQRLLEQEQRRQNALRFRAEVESARQFGAHVEQSKDDHTDHRWIHNGITLPRGIVLAKNNKNEIEQVHRVSRMPVPKGVQVQDNGEWHITLPGQEAKLPPNHGAFVDGYDEHMNPILQVVQHRPDWKEFHAGQMYRG